MTLEDSFAARLVSTLAAIRVEVVRLTAEVAELRRVGAPRPALPVAEAAHLLGCERSTVFELLRAGRLRRGKRTGRKTLITRASIDAYLASADAVPPRNAEPTPGGEVEREAILKLVRRSSRPRGAEAGPPGEPA